MSIIILFSPFSDAGLYINISTFQAVGVEYLHSDALRTNSRLYLHAKYEQMPKKNDILDNNGVSQETPTKLAIGVDGGFDLSPKFTVNKSFCLFVYTEKPSAANKDSCPGQFIPLPFVVQHIGRELVPSIVHDVTSNSIGHIGLQVPEFVRNICIEILNHDGMTSRMQVNLFHLSVRDS